MSQQFLGQARELWQTVSSPETIKSYKDVLSLTWQILQRLGKTLWLGLCLVLVGLDWLGSTGIEVGRSARAWAADVQNAQSEDVAAETGQRMLQASKVGVTNAVSNARKQLGLSEKPTMLALLTNVTDGEKGIDSPSTVPASVSEPSASQPVVEAAVEVVSTEPSASGTESEKSKVAASTSEDSLPSGAQSGVKAS